MNSGAVPAAAPLAASRERAVYGVAWLLPLGALSGLGRPGIDCAPVFFVGLWLSSYWAARSATLPRAAAAGTLWGLGLFSVVSLGTWSWGAVVPIALTAIGTMCYSLPLACAACWGARRLTGASHFIVLASAWALWMQVCDHLGFPLKLSVLALAGNTPELLAGARWVGGDLLCGIITAAVVVSATDAARMARSAATWSRALVAGRPLVTGFFLVAGLAILARTTATPPASTIDVGVPQLNASSAYYRSRVLAPHLVKEFDAALARQLAALDSVDLLVMTEGFDGRFGLMLPAWRKRWQELARERGQALLVTSHAIDERGYQINAAASVDDSGAFVAEHHKVDLAFHGERTLARGRDYVVHRFRGLPALGVMICQESVVPWASRSMVRSGAELLAVSTSDVTFGSSATPFEHLALSQLRAVEVGRDVVWASNAGPSGLIDRFGAFQAHAPFREAAAATVHAAAYVDQTPFLRLSSWLSWANVACLVGYGVQLRRHRLRSAATALAEPDTTPREREDARALGLAISGLASLALAVLVVAASPALVELSRGNSERARSAVTEHFTEAPPMIEPATLKRFQSAPSESFASAASYLLATLGLDTSVDALPRPLPEASGWEPARDYLRRSFGLSTRVLPLRAEALPRVAVLARFRDGAWAVLEDPDADGNVTLFSTGERRTPWLRAEQIESELMPEALLVTAPETR